MQYVKGSANGAADGLSRLPLKCVEECNTDERDYLNFLIEDKLSIDCKQLRIETRNDIVLSKVFTYLKKG